LNTTNFHSSFFILHSSLTLYPAETRRQKERRRQGEWERGSKDARLTREALLEYAIEELRIADEIALPQPPRFDEKAGKPFKAVIG